LNSKKNNVFPYVLIYLPIYLSTCHLLVGRLIYYPSPSTSTAYCLRLVWHNRESGEQKGWWDSGAQEHFHWIKPLRSLHCVTTLCQPSCATLLAVCSTRFPAL